MESFLCRYVPFTWIETVTYTLKVDAVLAAPAVDIDRMDLDNMVALRYRSAGLEEYFFNSII